MSDSVNSLIVLYGPPCSGKSVLGSMYQTEYNFIYLSTDQLRLNYFAKMNDLYREDNVAFIYNKLFCQVDEILDSGKSIIIEGMFLTNKFKSKVFDFSEKSNISFVYVTARYEALARRLSIRSRKSSGNFLQHQIPLSMERLYDFYSRATMPSNKQLILDTTFDTISTSYVKLKNMLLKKYSIDFYKENILNESASN